MPAPAPTSSTVPAATTPPATSTAPASGVNVSLAVAGAQASGSGSDTLTGIEHLIGSTHADTLSGDGSANRLEGGNGNDTLAGGAGNDTLLGGVGADTFRFDTLPNAATNRDTIGDFNVLDDTIQLENAIFASLLNPGTLAAGSFRAGAGVSAAADADDFVTYDSSSGALYYDANGNTGAGAVQIASLGSGLTLNSLDFVIT
jgi:serralysin